MVGVSDDRTFYAFVFPRAGILLCARPAVAEICEPWHAMMVESVKLFSVFVHVMEEVHVLTVDRLPSVVSQLLQLPFRLLYPCCRDWYSVAMSVLRLW
jgi:hypothetical protein